MNPPDRRQFLRHGFTLGAGLALTGSLPRLAAADAKTTQAAPKGFFTLGRRKDHWWLITPDGKPFFTVGLNHIDPASLRYPENFHLCGAYRRNKARRCGLLDEQEKPDTENVALITAANQKIAALMAREFPSSDELPDQLMTKEARSSKYEVTCNGFTTAKLRRASLLMFAICRTRGQPAKSGSAVATAYPKIPFIAVNDLRDDWFAGMAKPKKGGEKKWVPGMEPIKKKWLTPEEKHTARDEERAKKKAQQ